MENKLIKTNITIDGNQVEGASYISIRQWLDRHHEFSISLPFEAVEGADELTITKPQKWVGKAITIDISLTSGKALKFNGIVTNIGFVKVSSGERNIEVNGYSPTILLEHGSRYAAFYQKNIQQIAKKALDESSQVKAKISPKNNPTEEYYVKYNETNYAFLKRLAAQSGNWFFYNGTEVVFGDAPSGESSKLGYLSELLDFNLQVHYPSGEFQMKEWNYLKNEVLASNSKDISVNGMGTYGQGNVQTASNVLSPNPFQFSPKSAWQSLSTLKAQVQYQKKNDFGGTVHMSGSSDEISLKIGGLIDVQEHYYGNGDTKKEKDLGNYRVVNLTHHIGQDGRYTNSFSAIPADIEFYATHSYTSPQADPQMAKVMENNDPEKLGRVRVSFLWQTFQDDNEPSMWIPVLSSHVHGETQRGTYFIPEKGDMVTVIFENGDPTRPLIIGGIHHKSVLPKDFVHEQNYYKVIATRSGNQIFISDEPGKEEIRIYNKDKKNKIILSLDDPHIAIESSGTIDLKAKEIKMKADKIDFNATNEWKIEAGKTEFNNQQGLKVSAGTEIALNSNGQMTVESKSQTKVKGGAQLQLEGGADASLKAAIVRIN
jgi:uncharacterized protein involved in type VI secretion and phage assembly